MTNDFESMPVKGLRYLRDGHEKVILTVGPRCFSAFVTYGTTMRMKSSIIITLNGEKNSKKKIITMSLSD